MCVREVMYNIYRVHAGFLGWPGARITNATPCAASSRSTRRIPCPYRSMVVIIVVRQDKSTSPSGAHGSSSHLMNEPKYRVLYNTSYIITYKL